MWATSLSLSLSFSPSLKVSHFLFLALGPPPSWAPPLDLCSGGFFVHGAPPSVGQGEADVGLVELMSVPKTDGLGRDAPFKTEVERGAQEGGGPMERTRTNRDNNKSSQNRDKIEQQQIETKSRQKK